MSAMKGAIALLVIFLAYPFVFSNAFYLDIGVALQAFFDGVHEHEKGSEIWKESLDESR